MANPGLMMIIYFVLFFFLLCAVIAGFRPKASRMNRGLYLLVTILMIACAGLRAESVGRDYGTYRIYFDASPDTVGPGFIGQWSSMMPFVEVAYVFLNSLVKKAANLRGVVLIVALTVVALYAVFFWKHSRFSAIALMIYFSHAFLNTEMIQIRAGLAAFIGLWAFYFWASDRKRWGAVLVLLAIMIHLAIMVAVIPLLLFHFRLVPKPKYVILTVLLAVLIGYNLSSSFALFSQVERLASFQDTEYSTSVGIFSNVVTIKQLVILGLLCWLMNSRARDFFSVIPALRHFLLDCDALDYCLQPVSDIGSTRRLFPVFCGTIPDGNDCGCGLPGPISPPVPPHRCLERGRFAFSMLVLDLYVKEVVDDYRTRVPASVLLPYSEAGEAMVGRRPRLI